MEVKSFAQVFSVNLVYRTRIRPLSQDPHFFFNFYIPAHPTVFSKRAFDLSMKKLFNILEKSVSFLFILLTVPTFSDGYKDWPRENQCTAVSRPLSVAVVVSATVMVLPSVVSTGEQDGFL